MELTIENLRTLAQGGQIFLTAHSQARLYERGILLADIRQAIQSGKIIEYRPDDYRCPSCLVLGVNLAGRWLHVVCGVHEGAPVSYTHLIRFFLVLSVTTSPSSSAKREA